MDSTPQTETRATEQTRLLTAALYLALCNEILVSTGKDLDRLMGHDPDATP